VSEAEFQLLFDAGVLYQAQESYGKLGQKVVRPQ
jgi:hypothetical protein